MKIFNHRFVLITLLFTLISLITLSGQSLASTKESATMSISADALVTAVPDMAILSIAVSTKDDDISKAYNKNTKEISSLLTALKDVGVKKFDIQTDNYFFSPDYDFNEHIHKGFIVENSITIVIRDIDSIGKVINVALNNGANKINSLYFTLSDFSKIQPQALDKAIDNANSKANLIAQKLGLKIIGVKSVSESSTQNTSPLSYSSTSYKEMSVSSAVPIETGTISCTSYVNIEYFVE